MQARYAARFDRLERQKGELLKGVEALPAGELSRAPGEGEWSVAQVVDHLAGAERRSIEYIRKKTQDPSQLVAAGPGAALRSLALAAALRSPLRFNVPPGLAQPLPETEWHGAVRGWDQVRGEWRTLLAGFPAELAGKAVFRHPVAGYQTMTQALRFMSEHLRHHQKQVRRILAKLA